jgi:hypothetical protein
MNSNHLYSNAIPVTYEWYLAMSIRAWWKNVRVVVFFSFFVHLFGIVARTSVEGRRLQ